MVFDNSIFNAVQRLTQAFIGEIKHPINTDVFEPEIDYHLLDKFYESAPCVTFIYNHYTLGYNYFSPNVKQVLGYDGEDFIKGGLRFAMSLVHPTDSKIYSNSIIPTMFRYMGHYMITRKIKDLKFTFSFRIQNKNGNYIWAMHQMTVVKSSLLGIPTLTQTNITDITAIKNDDSIDFAIMSKSNSNEFKILYSKQFTPTEVSLNISSRELDVLRLLSLGKTSQEIASELNISYHTVNNHRKNMMERNKSKNTTELVQMASEIGILKPESFTLT